MFEQKPRVTPGACAEVEGFARALVQCDGALEQRPWRPIRCDANEFRPGVLQVD
jgi:hypothetical protein